MRASRNKIKRENDNSKESLKLTEKSIKANKELAKLQLFGESGPKMKGLGILPTKINGGTR